MSHLSNNLINEIKILTQTIPGIVSFSTFDEINSDENIIINEKQNGELDIRIAVIINKNISINNIVDELKELIIFNSKKLKITNFVLNLYVKGVK